MLPEICQIGPFTIYSYGLSLVAAFIIGSLLAKQEAKRQNINPDIIFNLAFLVFISGIVGSRIFYIIENFPYYAQNPMEILMLQRGGLSWFGGFLLGTFMGLTYIKKNKLKALKTMDLIIPYVALGQGIGRIGCLLNGCCYGGESKFGIYFPVHNAVLIPTQLYSSLFLLFIFCLLRFIQRQVRKDGEIFFTYLLLYSGMRFFMEFYRAEHKDIFLQLNLFQIISALLFILSFGLLASLKIKK